jgi:hypothetical protein
MHCNTFPLLGAILSLPQYAFMAWCSVDAHGLYLYHVFLQTVYSLSLPLPLPLSPQPSLDLGLLRNLLPLKMSEFLGGFSTMFFFTG